MPVPAPRALAAPGAASAALAPGAAAATSHVKLWQNTVRTLDCGIELALPGEKPSQILCSAVGLPAPPARVGDPFVRIGRHGPPHIVRISDDESVSTKIVRLKPGTSWSALGVTCRIRARSATCRNASGHGFTIGKRTLKTF